MNALPPAGSADDHKRAAAQAALEHVTPGMRLGLGTGSTAAHFVALLGEKVAAGLEVICVTTSEATEAQAAQCGIPLTTLNDLPELDLCVDGADEVDPQLRLIKGAGGALLREKMVAQAAARMIVIADSGKQVETLGAFPLSIEIVPFAAEATTARVKRAYNALGMDGTLTARMRPSDPSSRFITDNGNVIIDAAFGPISNPAALADALLEIPGVVEHGLFLTEADLAIIGGPNGVETVLR